VRRHRGVSAPSFRDGAIRFCARASRRKRLFFLRRRDTLFIHSIDKKRVRTEGTENTEKRFLGKRCERLGTPNFSLAWFHLFIGSVPKPASRRKRPFFSRRRDTPFIRSEGQKSGFAQRARRTQRGQASRRKRSFFSRRRDTLFRRAKKGSRGPVGYPAIPHGHRGVSAPSFRDARYPGFRSFQSSKNRVRTENTENTEDTERTQRKKSMD